MYSHLKYSALISITKAVTGYAQFWSRQFLLETILADRIILLFIGKRTDDKHWSQAKYNFKYF